MICGKKINDSNCMVNCLVLDLLTIPDLHWYSVRQILVSS